MSASLIFDTDFSDNVLHLSHGPTIFAQDYGYSAIGRVVCNVLNADGIPVSNLLQFAGGVGAVTDLSGGFV